MNISVFKLFVNYIYRNQLNKKGGTGVGVNRLFLGAFNAKVFGEEIIEKKEKSFDEILQEEHIKLIQLVSKMGKKRTLENLYQKYNKEAKYNSSSDE
jgi:hypothetical protein